MSKKKATQNDTATAWFTVQVRALREALALLRGVAPLRSTLPVLSHVLVKTTTDALTLAATDLSVFVSLRLTAQVDTPDLALALPARTFGDWLNAQELANDAVLVAQLNVETATAELKSARHTAHFNGIPANEFPTPPDVADSRTVHLDAATFAHSVQRVTFATAKDDVRPILTGVFVQIAGSTLTFAAADGFQLTRDELRLDDDAANAPHDAHGVVPADALELAARLADRAGAVASVALTLTETQARFRIAENEVVTTLIDEEYPQFERIIPTGYATHATLELAPITAALKAAAPLSDDGVALTFDLEKLTLAGVTPETGDISAQVLLRTAQGINAPFNVRVQSVFLRRVCAALGDVEELGFELGSDPHQPVVLYAPSAPAWKYVVMPLAN